MTKTVRVPEDLHEELAARKRPDETMADVIARYLHRPHPRETREMLTGDEAVAVEHALDGMYGASDRLDRARAAFEDADDGDVEGDSA